MKKTISIFILLTAFLLNFSSAQSFSSDVLPRLFVNWLTKYTNVSDFRPHDYITRWEASKFISSYAEVNGMKKNDHSCKFNDIFSYDSTLVPYITISCEYGLFKWHNGNFMPTKNITESQALAVVIRSLEWYQNETKSPWYTDYFNIANQLWILNNETLISIDQSYITREKLATWLYKTSNVYEGDSNLNMNDPFTFSDLKSWREKFVIENDLETNEYGNMVISNIELNDLDSRYVLLVEAENISSESLDFDRYQPVWLDCRYENNINEWFVAKLFTNPIEEINVKTLIKWKETFELWMVLDDASGLAIDWFVWKRMMCIINAPLSQQVAIWGIYINQRNKTSAYSLPKFLDEWFVHYESNMLDNDKEIVLKKLTSNKSDILKWDVYESNNMRLPREWKKWDRITKYNGVQLSTDLNDDMIKEVGDTFSLYIEGNNRIQSIDFKAMFWSSSTEYIEKIDVIDWMWTLEWEVPYNLQNRYIRFWITAYCQTWTCWNFLTEYGVFIK